MITKTLTAGLYVALGIFAIVIFVTVTLPHSRQQRGDVSVTSSPPAPVVEAAPTPEEDEEVNPIVRQANEEFEASRGTLKQSDPEPGGVRVGMTWDEVLSQFGNYESQNRIDRDAFTAMYLG